MKQEMQKKIIKLTEQKEELSSKIQSKSETHVKALEYNQYKNNSHIIIGTITLTGMLLIMKTLDESLLNSILISILPTTGATFGAYKYFSNKRKKLKKDNPTIDFKNYDVDENRKIIDTLHNQKMLLVDELEKAKQQYNATPEKLDLNSSENIVENYEQIEYQKVKTLKRM